jgi:hypothetical protein
MPMMKPERGALVPALEVASSGFRHLQVFIFPRGKGQ